MLKTMEIINLYQICVYCKINGSIINMKCKNLAENAMSEVHYSIKNLPSFVSNYRSTVNTYAF